MKACLCSLFLAMVLAVASGQEPLSHRVANYEMDVNLNVDQKQLEVTTGLLWINPSPDTVRELQFHIYYNAFKNNRSTWMQEGEQFMKFVGSDWYEDCDWGWSAIHQMKDDQGNDLTKGFEFIHPDDDNIYDETVLHVPLVDPVMPFDTARFEFAWKAQIPQAMIRTGYNKDFYFFAQWFPKLGVYEPAGMRYATKGGWNCHQYHADGEYYSDFGNYHVRLTVPEGFIVGASGVLIEKNTLEKSTTWTFQASDVIDFTWTTSPRFTVIEDQWQDVKISLMMYPEHKTFVPRYLESIHNVLAFMDTHVGDYPYPNVTIVDPPIHGMFVGGMEYPTLITSFSTVLLPSTFKSTETLVVHEFIHQYFQQMVATHEQEEPWMDEGITSYYEARIMDEYYGETTSMTSCCGINIGNFEFTRHEFFSSGHVKIAPNTLRSWEFRHGGYSAMSYNKVALWMNTLEGLVGVEVLDKALRTYFEQWKFKHPCGRDFVTIVNEVVAARLPRKWPEGMDWFFEQVLEGTNVCDYAVASIENNPLLVPMGYVNDTSNCVYTDVRDEEPTLEYESRVILHRLGELMLPVEVLIRFENGHGIIEQWDGKSRSEEFGYQGSRVVSVEIDPNRKIYLDLNFINNSKTVSIQKTGINYYFTKCLTSVQHLMETLSLIM